MRSTNTISSSLNQFELQRLPSDPSSDSPFITHHPDHTKHPSTHTTTATTTTKNNMAKPTRPPANAFVAFARKAYNPIGFSKGYNFVLFFIFAGAMMGFTLASLSKLDHRGTFCPSTGDERSSECYWLTQGGIEEIGIRLHLATILPASFLVCFQFVPAIRHRVLLFHRVNGYVILVLSLTSVAGALMIARRTYGGGLDVQTGVGFLAILFVGSMVLAYVNVKRLQLEQHRAWMLRGWFYVCFFSFSPSHIGA